VFDLIDRYSINVKYSRSYTSLEVTLMIGYIPH